MYDDAEHGQVFSKTLYLVWFKVSELHERQYTRPSLRKYICTSYQLVVGLTAGTGFFCNTYTVLFSNVCAIFLMKEFTDNS